MVLDIHIISQEMIKPSSPTPINLLTLELSALDQIIPAPFYVPTIFFYNAEQPPKSSFSRDCVSQGLKRSLSDTLSLFYPFAGRRKSNHSVTCNDEGVKFIESEAHTTLSRVLKNSDVEELHQFLPMDPCNQTCSEVIIAIRINYFDCGGIAIATCINHNVLDGLSYFMFMNSWAASSIGASNIITPNFSLAKHFPATQASSNFQIPVTGMGKKILTKRFVFDKKMIMALKTASAFGSQVRNPSRVEAITSFIWRVLLKDAKFKNKKINCSLRQLVNLRSRMGDLEDNIIGNVHNFSTTTVRSEEYTDDLDIVSPMRKSIKELEKDVVKMLANKEGYVDFIASRTEMNHKEENDFFTLSSLITFPVYEMDFGWGKPAWMCITTVPFPNMVFLVSTRSGEGIEAWINLYAEDMIMVEEAYKSFSLSLAD